MPIFLSSAAKAKLNFRFPAAFNGGRIDVYTGPQPAGSDFAPTGSRIATVTAPGGLQFILAGMVASKDPAQLWTLQGVGTGVAGWFRLVADPNDPGYVSNDYIRLDGLCWPLADPHTGLVLPALSITPETTRPIDGFNFSV